MSTYAVSNKVLTGPYVGKTRSELRTLLTTLQSQLSGGGQTLTGASINGQSLQFAQGPSVLTQIKLVQQALAQVDPDFIAPSGTINVRFTSGC